MNEMEFLIKQKEIVKSFFEIAANRKEEEDRLKRSRKEQEDNRRKEEDRLKRQCKEQEDNAQKNVNDKLSTTIQVLKGKMIDLSSVRSEFKALSDRFPSNKNTIRGGWHGWLAGIGTFLFFALVWGSSLKLYFWGTVFAVVVGQIPRLVKKYKISHGIRLMGDSITWLENKFKTIEDNLKGVYSKHNITIDTAKGEVIQNASIGYRP